MVVLARPVLSVVRVTAASAPSISSSVVPATWDVELKRNGRPGTTFPLASRASPVMVALSLPSAVMLVLFDVTRMLATIPGSKVTWTVRGRPRWYCRYRRHTRLGAAGEGRRHPSGSIRGARRGHRPQGRGEGYQCPGGPGALVLASVTVAEMTDWLAPLATMVNGLAVRRMVRFVWA